MERGPDECKPDQNQRGNPTTNPPNGSLVVKMVKEDKNNNETAVRNENEDDRRTEGNGEGKKEESKIEGEVEGRESGKERIAVEGEGKVYEGEGKDGEGEEMEAEGKRKGGVGERGKTEGEGERGKTEGEKRVGEEGIWKEVQKIKEVKTVHTPPGESLEDKSKFSYCNSTSRQGAFL